MADRRPPMPPLESRALSLGICRRQRGPPLTPPCRRSARRHPRGTRLPGRSRGPYPHSAGQQHGEPRPSAGTRDVPVLATRGRPRQASSADRGIRSVGLHPSTKHSFAPERSACRSATRKPQTRMIRHSTRRQRASTATWRRTWSMTWCYCPGSLNGRPYRLEKFGRPPSTGVLGFHRR